MRLYVIVFEDTMQLARAFDLVLAAPEVESCVVESESRRVRLLAPEAVTESLVERIYLYGGLSWCSRHPLDASQTGLEAWGSLRHGDACRDGFAAR